MSIYFRSSVIMVVLATAWLLGSTSQAHAQAHHPLNFVGLELETPHLKNGSAVEARFVYSATHRLRFEIFGFTSLEYGKVYVGPTLTMKQHFELNFSAGASAQYNLNDIEPLYAVSVRATPGHWQLLGLLEFNNNVLGSDAELFYDTSIHYHFKHLNTGIRARSHLGAGPSLEAYFRKGSIKLFAAWLPIGAEFKPTTSLFGGKLLF